MHCKQMKLNMKKILIVLLLLSCSTLLSAQEQVSVGGITFYLADGYSIRGRSLLDDGETLRIAPDPNPDNLRLVLKVLPNALEGIDGLTSEEVSDMLTGAVNKFAWVIANTEYSGYTLDKAYRITFEDDANCPIAYSDLSGKDQNGDRFLLHAEAALTDGYIISCCAIANNKGNLDELVDIYRELMAGDRDVPQGMVPTRPVSAAGITFELDKDLSIARREDLDPGENILIVPDGKHSDCEQMFLLILPDVLPNANRVSADRLSELLKSSVSKLADVIVKNYGLKTSYNLQYDGSGLYPNAYTNFKGKDGKGTSFTCHVEAALVDGSVISCCAVAEKEALLSRMVGVYESAVGAALRK